MKLITPEDPKWKDMVEYVKDCHGWCRITDLSGEMELGIYMATFADDYRIIFEFDNFTGEFELMPTERQTEDFAINGEDVLYSTICEIMVFFYRFMEEQAIKGFSDFQQWVTGGAEDGN